MGPKFEYTRILHLPKNSEIGALDEILFVVVDTQYNGAHKESESTKKQHTHRQKLQETVETTFSWKHFFIVFSIVPVTSDLAQQPYSLVLL